MCSPIPLAQELATLGALAAISCVGPAVATFAALRRSTSATRIVAAGTGAFAAAVSWFARPRDAVDDAIVVRKWTMIAVCVIAMLLAVSWLSSLAGSRGSSRPSASKILATLLLPAAVVLVATAFLADPCGGT